ncbi:TerD family protein [Spirillospora sp. NBC_00431]
MTANAHPLLTAPKVRSDADFNFCHQPVSSDGAVELDTATRQVRVDLARLPTDVSTVLLATSGPPGAVGVTVTERNGPPTPSRPTPRPGPP